MTYFNLFFFFLDLNDCDDIAYYDLFSFFLRHHVFFFLSLAIRTTDDRGEEIRKSKRIIIPFRERVYKTCIHLSYDEESMGLKFRIASGSDERLFLMTTLNSDTRSTPRDPVALYYATFSHTFQLSTQSFDFFFNSMFVFKQFYFFFLLFRFCKLAFLTFHFFFLSSFISLFLFNSFLFLSFFFFHIPFSFCVILFRYFFFWFFFFFLFPYFLFLHLSYLFILSFFFLFLSFIL